MYYTYMLRCEDNTIYTGIATDLERRMEEHFTRSKKCAKYTLTHHAKELEAAWKSETRVLASKLEFHIKRLSRNQKEELIKNNSLISKFLVDKIDSTLYNSVNINNIKGA